jgi:hypothetical protein
MAVKVGAMRDSWNRANHPYRAVPPHLAEVGEHDTRSKAALSQDGRDGGTDQLPLLRRASPMVARSCQHPLTTPRRPRTRRPSYPRRGATTEIFEPTTDHWWRGWRGRSRCPLSGMDALARPDRRRDRDRVRVRTPGGGRLRPRYA